MKPYLDELDMQPKVQSSDGRQREGSQVLSSRWEVETQPEVQKRGEKVGLGEWPQMGHGFAAQAKEFKSGP